MQHDSMNREQYREEAEYITYLLHERRLFAWCLMRYGEIETAVAYREALTFYPYKPIVQTKRETVFEEEAWHWAMIRIFGTSYSQNAPQMIHPPHAYHEESDRIFGYE